MAHYKGAANEATRAMHIIKKRERAKEELELKKRKLEEDLKFNTIDTKFATHHDATDGHMPSSTVGLVTLEQIRQKQEDLVKERDRQLAHRNEEPESRLKSQHDEQTKKETLKKNKTLSFGYDDDDDDDDGDSDIDSYKNNKEEMKPVDESVVTIEKRDEAESSQYSTILDPTRKSDKCSKKLLDIDTGLLPDREREEEERLLREKLAGEWRERQQRSKEEEIEITFSYWDGSGHRRVVKMKKGNTIYQFLQACLENLRKDFNELRSIAADHLVYVKEDLIIPHHYTFYDFIVTKARGKSGPLFSFDVHDDIRLAVDASVEKDESHAGKVLLRSWYERNKHIFPASRWEPYDPTKTYEKYTISDKKNK